MPQNRPRVIIVGVRKNILPESEQLILMDKPVSVDEPSAVREGFLPAPSGAPPSLVDLLSDLEDPDYVTKAATERYVRNPRNSVN